MSKPLNHSTEMHKLILQQLHAAKIAAQNAAKRAAKRAAYLKARA